MESAPKDLESLNLVYVARFNPEPSKARTEEKPLEKKEAPKPKPVEIMRKNPIHHPPNPPALNMPEMDLDIDPRISGGIPTISPPTEPDPVKQEALPDFNTVIDQGDLDILPKLSFRQDPKYPYRARRMGLAGEVKLRFLVDKNGMVSQIEILSATPPGIFDESVIEAVSSWKYLPGELLGRKVATQVSTSVVFKLEAN